jgi:hypothetical protein
MLFLPTREGEDPKELFGMELTMVYELLKLSSGESRSELSRARSNEASPQREVDADEERRK